MTLMTECLSGNFQEQINPTPVIGESDSGFGERISTSSCRLRFEDFDIDPGCDQNRHNATASATVLLQEGNLILLLPYYFANTPNIILLVGPSKAK